ncbi:MAG: MerR family DNA-binding transcriptional regulator [Rhizobiales bacterium]|jgi:DNA-binding transcriptional MerR regulator|nr:MerR family DNA-binding transcriptional regulator [Hyphomicrobiales bacterium]MBO6699149.1 MerR family DNA-binding transcriptional regulator [Hyphomicrobiales bacterium]MBO6736687.1 MerR family DNA-binding transcriptional regulator [Hyphomicrobiales bacterium]MBO6912239.1 MerR family DNA-binding transcriptional regulator [Hyphomicrobiales bacterium]MBO6956242.1 MerR family DNA-binding transcriptional regulator [Hyphomicrobiales bacterium]
MDTATRETEYSIGELAREYGLTLRTLRFYEDRGLLRPRRVGMQRIYSRRDKARLKLIVMGKRVGFSLQEIGEMLDLYDLKDGQAGQLKVARSRFLEQIAVLNQQKTDIEQAIVELERTVEVVTGMLKEKQQDLDGGGEAETPPLAATGSD